MAFRAAVEACDLARRALSERGEDPEPGPGECYVRSRLERIDAGTWGDRGLAKVIAEQLKPGWRIEPPSDEDRLRQLVVTEARRLGAWVGHGDGGFTIEWPSTPDDHDGRKRGALARQRAEEALRAEQEAGQ
jgi:hypothetical protein